MRYLCLISFMWFIFSSCQTADVQKEPFNSLLKNCNAVNVVLYNNGDTVDYETKDTAGIRILVQSVTGANEEIPAVCQPLGEIRYKSNDSTIFNARFSTIDSSKNDNCDFITYDYQSASYKHKLSRKAVMLLSTVRKQSQSSATGAAGNNPTNDTLR